MPLASINAEVYSPIAQRLKRQSPLSNTVMVTLAHGCAETAIADGLTRLIGSIK